MNYYLISLAPETPDLIRLYAHLLNRAMCGKGTRLTAEKVRLFLKDAAIRHAIERWYEEEFDGEDPYP